MLPDDFRDPMELKLLSVESTFVLVMPLQSFAEITLQVFRVCLHVTRWDFVRRTGIMRDEKFFFGDSNKDCIRDCICLVPSHYLL